MTRSPRARGGWALLGLTPFALYVLVFMAVPTILAVATGFVDADGRLTLGTIAALGDPVILRTFGNSLLVSGVTAVVGAAVGALVCFALAGLRADGWLRTLIDAGSSVLAQFGGVMLAFAFIATIGLQGLVTRALLDGAGIDIYADRFWLYEVPGLMLVYIYFQVPLMVITFMPALDGLRPQWAEAHAALGGSRAGFWRHVGAPVLAPSFFGCLLLLFANAFSSFATAAALVSQGSPLVTLQIRGALISETVLGRENLAGGLAGGMIVVMAVLMTAYALLQRRAARWQR